MAVHAARGVVRRGDDDGLRALGQRVAYVCRADLEPSFARVDGHHNPVRGTHDRLVESERRRGNDDLVARVKNRHERGCERLCGAARHDELVGSIGEPLTGHIARDGLK